MAKRKSDGFDTDCYGTPPEVFRGIQRFVRRKFTWDAACTDKNALARPLYEHPGFVPGDSLSRPWNVKGTIFCNPPYSDVDPWFEAAIAGSAVSVLLSLSPNGESRWGHILDHVQEINITGRVDENGKDRTGRIAHIGPNGPESGFNRGSSIFLTNVPGIGQRSKVTLCELLRLGRMENS